MPEEKRYTVGKLIEQLSKHPMDAVVSIDDDEMQMRELIVEDWDSSEIIAGDPENDDLSRFVGGYVTLGMNAVMTTLEASEEEHNHIK